MTQYRASLDVAFVPLYSLFDGICVQSVCPLGIQGFLSVSSMCLVRSPDVSTGQRSLSQLVFFPSSVAFPLFYQPLELHMVLIYILSGPQILYFVVYGFLSLIESVAH